MQAQSQAKTYGNADPVFTYKYMGFTNGDTSSVLSGQPSVVAPQRVQNLWQFTESPTSHSYNLWQFHGDGTSRSWNGIQLSHVTSGGNFYSSISASMSWLPSPIVIPGMQYLLSFYAASSLAGDQLYWHRYLSAPGGAQGWGPTAVGTDPRRVVFTCVGAQNGLLDCGNTPTIALGSDLGNESIYWLFQGANNVFGGLPSDPTFQSSIPADLYVGGLQVEPSVTEKRSVLAMGDSLTQYDCSNVDRVDCTSWTAFAASILNVPFYNRGIGGQKCDSILARWPTDASPILTANAGYVIIECGTNDITAASTPIQIEQFISAMYSLAMKDGATPVVVTIGPFATAVSVNSAEATRQSVNQWIRTSFPLILDFDKVVADPNNPRRQNPAYIADGTHLNLAGRIAEGNYVAQSIAGNTLGYPSIWSFHSPIPYQPVLGSNPSNGMDFSPGPQREVGNYIILPSLGTLSSASYKFSFASALLSVTPAPLTASANDKIMTYGDTLPQLDGVISGALPADGISATYSTGATSSSPPGIYAIVPVLLDPKNRLSNYSITTKTGTLTIVPAPAISSLSPPIATSGGSEFALLVTGSEFAADSLVQWGGNPLVTQVVSSTSLSAKVPASLIATAGVAPITVRSTLNGVATSNTFEFEIDSTPASTNAPAFTTLTATVSPGSTANYPVTLPSAPTNVSVSCLNLPAGATCSYSQVTGSVTIATASSTPPGTYQVVTVFTETLPGPAPVLATLPVFLLPFAGSFRRRHKRRLAVLACVALAILFAGIISGCGAAAPSVTPPQSHQVTSSVAVTLVVK